MAKEKRKINKKKIIMLLIIIITLVLIVTGILIIYRNRLEPQENEELVRIEENGDKTNTSSKLKETKIFKDLEISNITITENNNVSLILADVKNNTNETKGDIYLDIQIVDKQGNEIIKISGYIETVKPGETVKLNTSATFDFANAYDIIITEAEQQ